MSHECADCRDAKRETDGTVKLILVRDPGTGKMVKRAYLCEEHEEMYASDGYEMLAQ